MPDWRTMMEKEYLYAYMLALANMALHAALLPEGDFHLRFINVLARENYISDTTLLQCFLSLQ